MLAFSCLTWVLRNESTRRLQASAEAAGPRWAKFAERTVPDLDRAEPPAKRAASEGIGRSPFKREGPPPHGTNMTTLAAIVRCLPTAEDK